MNETTYLVDTKKGFVKPVVRDFGRDGNAFALIGQVKRALNEAGHEDVASEFTSRALASHSYDEVLRLCAEYGDLRYYTTDEEDEEDEEEYYYEEEDEEA